MPRCVRGLLRHAMAACRALPAMHNTPCTSLCGLPLTATRCAAAQDTSNSTNNNSISTISTTTTRAAVAPRVQYDVQTAQLAQYTHQPTLPSQATLVTLDARVRRKGRLLDVARSLRSVAQKATADVTETKQVGHTKADGKSSPLVIVVESGYTAAAARRRQRRWTAQLRRKQQQELRQGQQRVRVPETHICVLDRHQTRAYRQYLAGATTRTSTTAEETRQQQQQQEKEEKATMKEVSSDVAGKATQDTVHADSSAHASTPPIATPTSSLQLTLAATLYYGASTEYLTVRARALLPALANVLVVECPTWSTIDRIEEAVMQHCRTRLFSPAAYNRLVCVRCHKNDRLLPLLPCVFVFRTTLPGEAEARQAVRLLQRAMWTSNNNSSRSSKGDDGGESHERDCVCVLDSSDAGGNPLLSAEVHSSSLSSPQSKTQDEAKHAASSASSFTTPSSWSSRIAACLAHAADERHGKAEPLVHTTAPVATTNNYSEGTSVPAGAFVPAFLYNLQTLLRAVRGQERGEDKQAALVSAAAAAAENKAPAVQNAKESAAVTHVQKARTQVKKKEDIDTTGPATKAKTATQGAPSLPLPPSDAPAVAATKTAAKQEKRKKRKAPRRRVAHAVQPIMKPVLRITVTRDPQPAAAVAGTRAVQPAQGNNASHEDEVAAVSDGVNDEFALPAAVDRGLPLTRSMRHAIRYVLTTEDGNSDNVRSYLSSLSISALLAGSRVYARVTPLAPALRSLLQLNNDATNASQAKGNEESNAWLATLPETATVVCVREAYPEASRQGSTPQKLLRADTPGKEGSSKNAGAEDEDGMSSAEARTVATLVMALVEANVKTGPRATPLIGIVYRNNLHSAAQCNAVRERIARLLERHTRYAPVALFVLMMV